MPDYTANYAIPQPLASEIENIAPQMWSDAFERIDTLLKVTWLDSLLAYYQGSGNTQLLGGDVGMVPSAGWSVLASDWHGALRGGMACVYINCKRTGANINATANGDFTNSPICTITDTRFTPTCGKAALMGGCNSGVMVQGFVETSGYFGFALGSGTPSAVINTNETLSLHGMYAANVS